MQCMKWQIICIEVWLSATLVGDSLVTFGGARWCFDPSCWGNDLPQDNINVMESACVQSYF